MMASFSGVVIRRLIASDIPSAVQLSSEAGWNQTSGDWCTLLELTPEGCLAIEVDGELAATTTLLCYGQCLAWIGMVLTRIRHRGRGFARRLMTQALHLADQMQIETVKLDATDHGRPLYEKLGFRCEQVVQRWRWAGEPGLPNVGFADQQTPRDVWSNQDLSAFGADRKKLLLTLARRSPPLIFSNSYLFTRTGRLASYLGPCVCEKPQCASTLFERALQTRSDGGWYWDLLPANEHAVALARALSFTPERHLIRMVRGRAQRGNEQAIFAIAGFELG
jgi:GNAT superfamily N-acetyltransferase